jgi:hypothetical protein
MSFLICFLLASSPDVHEAVHAAINRLADSARVTLIDGRDATRGVPPGVAPVLSFRYMEGSQKHRFGDLDLMVDDAGH